MYEIWIHYYTPETKQQSKQWTSKDESAPQKMLYFLKKLWQHFFSNNKGILLLHYLEKDRTISAEYYVNLSEKSHSKIIEKHPVDKKKIWFHQDSAHVHKAGILMGKLHELKFEILPHAPYSPEMAPSDNSFFPNLKNFLPGRRFCSNTEVIQATNAYFEALEESSNRERIQAFPHSWSKCISLEGD
ncbi:Histone-lysine N-methyltransferase SETMAR like protein [Argiope bruennichi]|uniref:Histone-lysine N-methyltransferase SETMAR like protein n=1 Tax=Argiope bruennichi TaxID=94029 RepID=A0A8T0F4M1_ARGBR|nr:Histone-lysine N-methyltransferase SETMAR like protein [Argiope bruennichi]